MASLAAACRVSARAASQQLRNHGARRALHAGQPSLAAQNFNMPALSPTMTEGNIASWKIKEGDSFSAGDVLLEIETDKAQMDVEAQDDGILAKIIQGDNSKQVQVGTRIAVTAEPGDDLSSLEIPAEDAAANKAEAPKEQPKEESKSVPKEERTVTPPAKSDSAKKSSSSKATKQTYPLYPSVEHLLKNNGLSKADADKIPASGPGGRLLKGDVLAYVGKIQESYPSELADRFTKLSHLDLSNIKVMPKKEAPAKKPAAAAKAPKVVEDLPVEIALPVSLTAVTECQKRVKDSIGVFLPLTTFIARATELANEDLPRSKTAKPTADELFNAVLGLDKVAGKEFSRGHFVPQVTSLPPTTVNKRPASFKKPDVLEILAGKKTVARGAKAGGGTERVVGPLNVFSVSVPKGDEKRGRVFLERVKAVLEAEPGRLVV
ncbi:Dihydrolipoyllysine-residue acetyltransferase [Ascochyta rabiei]|nr:Dihydrolipoyllysine-residue acetyltransferase [Ascochyta rabiei]UPX13632.1 Dihydrolipoyllysine-residue acetyltransferase [Ascochyta rabiei]